ncbi:hypothetical protein NUW54_g6757 [Trametes sanguinea]|uniref:Uncharacterized protein n=1 Tax=Trametes sanguinea TaxID=158606 RepID=A0ACC1PSC3_9APHY|nr:hypothetical protein NUW54_g6757 [Trametes sanguinea]
MEHFRPVHTYPFQILHIELPEVARVMAYLVITHEVYTALGKRKHLEVHTSTQTHTTRRAPKHRLTTTLTIPVMPAAEPSTGIPDDFVLDVHDLAAIILDAHARTEPLFAHSQLCEVYRGDGNLATFCDHFLDPMWHSLPLHSTQKRVAYILENDAKLTERVTFDAFASPQGVNTPGGRELTRRELEDVYWRCKDYDNGYVLSYVAQQVFNRLPRGRW